MGHPTFDELIEHLVSWRDAEFRSDPERDEARLNLIESVLKATLEKLRDQPIATLTTDLEG